MNLILSFVHPTKPARTVGPFKSVRLDAESLHDVASDDVVARHRDHQWDFEGERYFRLDSTSRVRIHFERERPYPHAASSRNFGPFDRFSAVDGIVYTDNRVFAFVDGKVGDCFCYEDGKHWTTMIVSDAGVAEKNGRWALLAAIAPNLPGVIALLQGLGLAYLGRANSIRAVVEELSRTFDTKPVTVASWEVHPDPAARLRS